MSDTAIGQSVAQRWRTIRWVLLALGVITAVSVLTTYLTESHPGGPMDPESTSPDGVRALVSLLREEGVEVIDASSLEEVRRAARPDTLLVVAETYFLVDDDGLRTLAGLPGDRLLVQPVSPTREALAPEIAVADETSFGGEPDCDMREAERAGDVKFGTSATYEAAGGVDLTRCYGGALVRYTDGERTITTVGTPEFMTNAELATDGNAALAMNLVGSRDRVIWYVPTFVEGESDSTASITDLIPDRVAWIVLQLCLAVLLVALWRGRRVGPLVAEDIPVVVRASETVEGRGRLYRSRRARDRAADALRTGTLQRMLPRLGLTGSSDPPAVTQAVAARIGGDPNAHAHWLFGPTPSTDAELVTLANNLDDIERQVSQS